MPGGLDHAFARLAAAIAARPGRILLVVALVVVAAAPFAIRVGSALEPRGFDVANSNSERARETIERDARFDPTNNVLLLFRARAPLQQRPSRERLRNLAGKLAADPAVVRVLDAPGAHNPAMIGRDGRSTYLIAQLRPLDDKEAEAAGKRIRATFAGDADVTLGGNPIANSEISETIEHDLRRAELLSVPLIVILSFFIFRGFVASLLAPLAGLITVLTSFFLLRILVELTSVSIYALNLVTGLSVGLSIDWSLLLVSRLREERAREPDYRVALRRALVGVGESILFSALTVAVSMATLLIFPLRFLRS